MSAPTLPLTLTITTQAELTALQVALENGYYTIREEYADGSGQASPEQEACHSLMRQVGLG